MRRDKRYAMNTDDILLNFIEESNMIEGIHDDPKIYLDMYEKFLALKIITVDNLQTFVSNIQPSATLRDMVGLDVHVGNYVPPYGGPEILHQLEYILLMINDNLSTPYINHIKYESLHPFTDGNGRSGRALWLWQTIRYDGFMPIDGSFLHTYYYESLSEGRK